MNEKKYFEVSIEINPEAAEIASDVLFSNFECDGVVTSEEEYKDLEIVNCKNNFVKGFIDQESADENTIKQTILDSYIALLENGFTQEELGSWKVSVKLVENEDWSKKWKENWKPTPITKDITICPSWIKYEKRPDELVINIDPGAAFGTGTHETTQLCVMALEQYMKKNDVVADIGTGTGILAFAASILGANSVMAIDNDPVAIEAAVENAKLNNIKNCKFETNEIYSINEQFDFVTANILHNVLAEIMGDLYRILKPKGKMVLSGILDTKAQVVKDAIEKCDLEIIEIKQLNQWVAIIVEKIR